jgi:hypothetical protein
MAGLALQAERGALHGGLVKAHVVCREKTGERREIMIQNIRLRQMNYKKPRACSWISIKRNINARTAHTLIRSPFDYPL